ncbi:MAG: TetR/AcrR family transcriptional regulator, partial [Gammaproteobacteria bacterium]|nr:TetR/AcrR family transcriptional regulator [Gammaproteobacteria bacterium]
DRALEAALKVFWRDGFQAASLTALTEAMGISRPSLYSAFGDKASLYIKAFERYVALELAEHRRALEAEPAVGEAVAACLFSAVRAMTDPDKPRGCFIVNGVADCGSPGMPGEVEEALLRSMQGAAAMFAERLARGVDDRQLPADADVDGLAAYLATVLSGLAVQAQAGVSFEVLRSVIGVALSAWPRSTAAAMDDSGFAAHA